MIICARKKSFLTWVMRTRTSSPASARGIKTTRPPMRATPSPSMPWEIILVSQMSPTFTLLFYNIFARIGKVWKAVFVLSRRVVEKAVRFVFQAHDEVLLVLKAHGRGARLFVCDFFSCALRPAFCLFRVFLHTISLRRNPAAILFCRRERS